MVARTSLYGDWRRLITLIYITIRKWPDNAFIIHRIPAIRRFYLNFCEIKTLQFRCQSTLSPSRYGRCGRSNRADYLYDRDEVVEACMRRRALPGFYAFYWYFRIFGTAGRNFYTTSMKLPSWRNLARGKAGRIGVISVIRWFGECANWSYVYNLVLCVTAKSIVRADWCTIYKWQPFTRIRKLSSTRN